ncbi:MAG: hypothetical protein JSS35_14100, partial [Proteobacteria bacterium]|nr:hypothetical protein [Pseudomonadota bacterium]
MIDNWTPLGGLTFHTATPFETPWRVVCESFGEATHVMVRAKGAWTLASDFGKCGPDGLWTAAPSSGLLLADAPLGCLIGKVGGSAAAPGAPPSAAPPNPLVLPAAPPPPNGAADVCPKAGVAFPLGSLALFELPDDREGPF